jgi:putative ABC transport system permease protein
VRRLLGPAVPPAVRLGAGDAVAQPLDGAPAVLAVLGATAVITATATTALAAATALLALAAVVATALPRTHERARDLAVLRAIGMTPAQVLAMAVASATVLAAAGAVLGVPAGLVLRHLLAG